MEGSALTSKPRLHRSSQAFDLTTIWYCSNWWNARWSDRHMVLCWLVECAMIWTSGGTVLIDGMHHECTIECTMIWPPCGTVLTGWKHDDLTTRWYCSNWWNARWSNLVAADISRHPLTWATVYFAFSNQPALRCYYALACEKQFGSHS